MISKLNKVGHNSYIEIEASFIHSILLIIVSVVHILHSEVCPSNYFVITTGLASTPKVMGNLGAFGINETEIYSWIELQPKKKLLNIRSSCSCLINSSSKSQKSGAHIIPPHPHPSKT
jgi:hypothetical protein